MEFTIEEEISSLCPGTALGVLHYRAVAAASGAALLEELDGAIARLQRELTLESIAAVPHIQATRQAYKKLGKSPHEYRNAAEAMLRRVVKGNNLYHINNVVDCNNLISISSGYSIGSYDLSQLRGVVCLRRAEDGAHYDGIGKSSVNIEHLPTLYDAMGAFGNPTSDSQRAMIRPGAREIISVLYSFDGSDDLGVWVERFADLLKRRCAAEELETKIV